jgi:MinD superfamily P-loop ATPase
MVRQQARRIAEEQGLDYIISDGPPGIGCPVISSLSGVNLAVVITEPTLSGIHDLDRVISVCCHFAVPVIVCINKYDLNHDNTHQIEDYCRYHGINMAGRIPYDNVVTEALVHGLPVLEYSRDGVAQEIERLWNTVVRYLS